MRPAVNPAPSAREQPPSRWTCVRLAVNPSPAGYETAAVQTDVCAPGNELSPCWIRTSPRPDGRVCARLWTQPELATKQPPSGRTREHPAGRYRLQAASRHRPEGRVLGHRKQQTQQNQSHRAQRQPSQHMKATPSRHRRHHHRRSLAPATKHPRPSTGAVCVCVLGLEFPLLAATPGSGVRVCL